MAVPAGDDTISLSIPKVGSGADSILLHKAVYNLKGDTYQTVHFTDTTTNTLGIITIDAANKPDSGYAQFRFINLIPNSPGVDLYFGNTRVAANVQFKSVTDTFRLAAGTSLTWALRAPDGTVFLKGSSRYTSASSVANQRVFTVYARGYMGVDSPDVRSPKISFAYNK